MSTIIRRISAMAIAAMSFAPVSVDSIPLVQAHAPKKRRETIAYGSSGAWVCFRYRSGPGWTVAQVKRMARKAKNRARNRAACRRNGH